MRFVEVHHAGLKITARVPEVEVPHMSPGWKVVNDDQPKPVKRASRARVVKRTAAPAPTPFASPIPVESESGETDTKES